MNPFLWNSWDYRIILNRENAIIQVKKKFLFWEYWKNDIQIFNNQRLDLVIERVKELESGYDKWAKG